MLSHLKTLYNSGENDGDICIMLKNNHQLSCHSYVVKYASDTIKNKLNQPHQNIIELNYEKKIVDIVLNFSYSEEIIDNDLTADEIMSLYNLINFLNMNNFIMELKNYYSRKFYKSLNISNWLHVICSIYNIDIYYDLYDPTVQYIKNSIIIDKNLLNNVNIDTIDNNIKTFLLKLSFQKIHELNTNLNNIIDIKDNAIKQKMNNIIKNVQINNNTSSQESDNDINVDLNDSDNDINDIDDIDDIIDKKQIKKKLVKNKKLTK
jgi:hypothetical protein